MVFFDANILIEALLKRENVAVATRLLRRASGEATISALTGHQVVYFGVKQLELHVVKDYLADFIILSLEQSDFDWAFTNMRDNDFEDALQLAVAIRNGCQTFVTLDNKLYKNYKNLPQLKLMLARATSK